MPLGPVLVTGASGFVGHAVCAALLREGAVVRGLVRSADRALPAGVEPALVPDLLDCDGLARAVAGVQVIIHLAGRAHVMRDRAVDPAAEYQRVNVDGTRAVLDAAVAAGVERLLLASSVKAVAEASETPLTERTPPAPQDAYGASKLAAERLALADSGAVAVTVLRFPLVYGAGVKANMLRLFRLVDRGVPLPFGGVRNRRSLLYIGNLAAACIAVLRCGTTAGEVLFVSDGRDVATPELLRLIGEALGRPARLWVVPPEALVAAGHLGDLLNRLVPFPLCSDTVERLLGSLPVDSSRLRTLTGFRAPYSVEAGLRETAQWFQTVARVA